MLRAIRSDNSREFVNNTLRNYFKEKGILHQTTIAYTPEQNGIAERTNRTIIEAARTMLLDAELPKEFWAEAMSTAMYLRNRCVNKATGNKTPEELWTGRKPSIRHIRIFGCKACKDSANNEFRHLHSVILIGSLCLLLSFHWSITIASW